MGDKKINFKVDYKKLKIFEEFNTENPQFPMVLSSPHSGCDFPPEFLANTHLSIEDLRESEDCFVTEMVLAASDAGIPLLSMNIPRTFVDVNRDKIELDDTMFYDAPQAAGGLGSRRSRVGFGVIHRIVTQNKSIYDGKISYSEAMERLEKVYDPYHKRLKQLVDRVTRKFGFCLLIDCHSMPSKICNIMNETKPVEFCLCTLFDESCPSRISEQLSRSLESDGYRVEFNRPYAGAFITFNYCQPRKNIYTLQLEVNRSLYMSENVYKKNMNFHKVSSDICRAILSLGKFLLDFKI